MTIEECVRKFPDFSEQRCKSIDVELGKMLQKLHEAGIYLCDLSPKNVLYNYETEKIKLTCFENSFKAGVGQPAELTILCDWKDLFQLSTLLSPEQVRWRLGREQVAPKAKDVDMWCKACIFYYCLYGCYPFDNYQSIENGNCSFTSERTVSDESKELLKANFDKEASNRPHNNYV